MSEKKNSLKAVKKFFVDVKAELKKVIWPTPKQTTNNTAVVIASIILVGILIAILDFAFSYVVNIFLYKGGKTAALILSGLINL